MTVEGGRILQKLNEPISVTLAAKEELAPDTFIYRFAFPEKHAGSPLGHLTCQYLQFESTIQGTTFQRFYHPLSKVSDEGYVDLLIRVYLKDFQNQAGGVFTQYIDRMREGDSSLKITAIGGDLAYKGESKFSFRNQESGEMEDRTFKKVGMIAAGSGIAPMFQLVQTVAASAQDNTALSLIYSNRTPVSSHL